MERVYKKGIEDVKNLKEEGGMGLIIREIIEGGMMNEDVRKVWGEGMRKYEIEKKIGKEGKVVREEEKEKRGEEKVMEKIEEKLKKKGGIKVMRGNIGNEIIKV